MTRAPFVSLLLITACGQTGSNNLPTALQQSAIDGSFSADGAGHFVANPNARRLVEYFLTASGQEPDEVLQARIERVAESEVSPRSRNEAIDFVQRYFQYRRRAKELLNGRSASGDLPNALAAIFEIRRSVFGDSVAQSVFGENVGPAPMPIHSLQGGANDLRRLRDQLVGSAAADRLEALERARLEWRSRLNAYRGELSHLDLTTEDGKARRQALLRAHFTPTEQLRVDSLERNNLLKGVTPPGPVRGARWSR